MHASYNFRRGRLRVSAELLEDRVLIVGSRAFDRSWESAFLLRDLQPLPQRILLRHQGFSGVVGAATLLGCSAFVTASHASLHLPDGAVVLASLGILSVGATVLLLNPFRVEWVTFNHANGVCAFSLAAAKPGHPDFQSFIAALSNSIAASRTT